MDYKLIHKKIYNKLTPEEEVIFNNWYNESKSHRDYYERVKAGYNKEPISVDTSKGWKQIEKQIYKPVRKLYWRIAAAVSVILIIGFAFFTNNHSVHQTLYATTDIEPGTSKAILTLEDGTDIKLKKGHLFKRENLICDGEKITYQNKDSLKGKQIKYNYLTIPRGGQYFIVLADGTKVWLNSDSKIKYPTEFIDGNTRMVELLYGEAYFDVSPSTSHRGSKFIVRTQMQKVEVVGTEFNIKAYSNEQYIYTTLIEGKIFIDNGTVKKILEPNQQSKINVKNNDLEIASIDVYDVISWKKGVFSFKEKTLYEITMVLSRWYDVNFVFENQEIKNIKFNGVLDKKQSITTILSILKMSINIDYEIQNRTIIIK
ncbi:MAG: FecR family protein [Chlorobi bacterium]|nr:FecR family protein [Chlorobiota bacterium]